VVAWSIAVAGTDLAAATEVLVSVTTTDGAGNRTAAPATQGYGVDTEAPELLITVADITDDNVVNAAESGVDVDVTGQVAGEFHENDTVTLTDKGIERTGKAALFPYSTLFRAGTDLAAATEVLVSVTTTDGAGN